MTMTLHTIHIYGKPVPGARPQVTKNGVFYSKDQKDYKRHVQACMSEYWGTMAPLEGTIILTIDIVLEPPASWSQKKQQAALGTAISVRPDVDNFAKPIMDAGNQIIWKDDGQICELRIAKRYGRIPKVIVNLQEL